MGWAEVKDSATTVRGVLYLAVEEGIKLRRGI